MPNPPPRARFQIHLSTAIVLMLAAGGLMWANMREHGESLIDNDIYHLDLMFGAPAAPEIELYYDAYGFHSPRSFLRSATVEIFMIAE